VGTCLAALLQSSCYLDISLNPRPLNPLQELPDDEVELLSDVHELGESSSADEDWAKPRRRQRRRRRMPRPGAAPALRLAGGHPTPRPSLFGPEHQLSDSDTPQPSRSPPRGWLMGGINVYCSAFWCCVCCHPMARRLTQCAALPQQLQRLGPGLHTPSAPASSSNSSSSRPSGGRQRTAGLPRRRAASRGRRCRGRCRTGTRRAWRSISGGPPRRVRCSTMLL